MTKLEDLDDGDGFLAWACNTCPDDEDTGRRCKVCGRKIWDYDICNVCASKSKTPSFFWSRFKFWKKKM